MAAYYIIASGHSSTSFDRKSKRGGRNALVTTVLVKPCWSAMLLTLSSNAWKELHLDSIHSNYVSDIDKCFYHLVFKCVKVY